MLLLLLLLLLLPITNTNTTTLPPLSPPPLSPPLSAVSVAIPCIASFLPHARPTTGCSGSCCHDCAETPTDKINMRMAMWDLYMAGYKQASECNLKTC
jgi:hypothetical protein